MARLFNCEVRVANGPPPKPIRITQNQQSEMPKTKTDPNCPVCNNKPIAFKDTTPQSRVQKPEGTNSSKDSVENTMHEAKSHQTPRETQNNNNKIKIFVFRTMENIKTQTDTKQLVVAETPKTETASNKQTPNQTVLENKPVTTIAPELIIQKTDPIKNNPNLAVEKIAPKAFVENPHEFLQIQFNTNVPFISFSKNVTPIEFLRQTLVRMENLPSVRTPPPVESLPISNTKIPQKITIFFETEPEFHTFRIGQQPIISFNLLSQSLRNLKIDSTNFVKLLFNLMGRKLPDEQIEDLEGVYALWREQLKKVRRKKETSDNHEKKKSKFVILKKNQPVKENSFTYSI